MIDTSKYEGHSKGPWRVVTHENNEWQEEPPAEGVVLIETPFPFPLTVAFIDNRWQMEDNGLDMHMGHSTTGATAREMFNANERLIADAPLLLEEVKRLREDNELYLACIHASHFRDKPGSAMSRLNQMRFLQRGEEE